MSTPSSVSYLKIYILIYLIIDNKKLSSLVSILSSVSLVLNTYKKLIKNKHTYNVLLVIKNICCVVIIFIYYQINILFKKGYISFNILAIY